MTSSLAAAQTGLQAVLVAGSALEGFEGIREAVAKHGHLAAMAHWARDEGKAPTGLARLGLLYPLKKRNGQIFFSIPDKISNITYLTSKIYTFYKTGLVFFFLLKPLEIQGFTNYQLIKLV